MGKTNLLYGFSALTDLVHTMDIRDIMEQLFTSKKMMELSSIIDDAPDLFQLISKSLPDVKAISQKARMVGTNAPVLLEYEFLISEKRGRYVVELGAEEIIHERLEYTLEKNKGIYFDLTSAKKKVNQRIFKSAETLHEIESLIDRFWGKHTLLAILLHEKNDKSEMYIENSLSNNFYTLINKLCAISCSLKSDALEGKIQDHQLKVLDNFESGTVRKQDEYLLDDTERALSMLFASINSDNRHVFYRRDLQEGGKIKYNLIIRKFISGEERDIDFELESSGNHQLLRVLWQLLFAMSGGTAIVDEIDAGIHDLLMLKLIGDALPYIKGQLIFATHNTALMEMKNIQQYIYIINEDEHANKTIRCIDDYDNRTYQLNNIRNKYFDGAYSGIPSIKRMDFGFILDALENHQ